MRDDAGRLLLAAGFLCEYLVIEEAELRAAWEAIRLLRFHYPGHSTWLEGDDFNVIRRLQVSNTHVDSSTLLADARELLRSMEIFKITHTYLEGNRYADWLTRWICGHGLDEVLLDGFPSGLKSLAEANAASVCCPREKFFGLRAFY